jgi:maleate isomerase
VPRRRLGLLVPTTNSTAEPDFSMAVPPGVTVHSHHIWLDPDGDNAASLARMNSELAEGARYLAQLLPELICMAGTANSFYQGQAGSSWMEEQIRSGSSGIRGVSSSPSISMALRQFGVKRLSVATPYPEWSNRKLAAYFKEAGFDVLNVESDPRIADGHSQHMNDQDPSEILEFAVSVARPQADALLCPCSGWRAMEVAARIEAAIGKPVVTTNQATLWRSLRLMGIDNARPGFGALLDQMPPLPQSSG